MFVKAHAFLFDSKDLQALKKVLEADPYADDSFARAGYVLKESSAAGLPAGKYAVFLKAEDAAAAKFEEKLKQIPSFAKATQEAFSAEAEIFRLLAFFEIFFQRVQNQVAYGRHPQLFGFGYGEKLHFSPFQLPEAAKTGKLCKKSVVHAHSPAACARGFNAREKLERHKAVIQLFLGLPDYSSFGSFASLHPPAEETPFLAILADSRPVLQ